MKRGLIVIATLFSLTACSAQQVQNAALYTVGAAIGTAIAIDEIMDDDETYCAMPDQTGPVAPGSPIGSGSPDVVRSGATCDAMLEADREARAAQRRAELNAALDAHNAAAPGADSEQPSIMLRDSDPVISPEVAARFNELVPEDSGSDENR